MLPLTQDQQRSLRQLAPATVQRIGAMADEHRVLRLAEHLPWFDLHKRPELIPLLAGYQTGVPPQLLNRLEATAFCAYLEGLPSGSPPYLQELARYDRRCIELAWGLGASSDGMHSESFHYPIEQIRAALEAPGWPAAAPTPTHLQFRKVPGLPAVLVRTITPSSP